MTKAFFILSLFLSFSSLLSQTSDRQWKSHFSFNEVKSIKTIDQKIYVATSNSVYIHDINLNQNEVFTTTEGLSGDQISTIFVTNEESLIFIGYENGLLQIINERTKEVRTLADITIQTDIPGNPFKINNFHRSNDIVFISTDFGIVEYSLSRNNFKETVKFPSSSIGTFEKVKAVTTLGNSVFATLENNQIKQANVNDNLLLVANWKTIQTKEINDFISFDNNVYGIVGKEIYASDWENHNILFRTDKKAEIELDSPIISFTILGNTVTVLTNSQILQYDNNLNPLSTTTIPTELQGKINLASVDNDVVFLSEINNGIQKATINNLTTKNSIGPNGPAANDMFKIRINDGDLWAVYGKMDLGFNNFTDIITPGPSSLIKDNWTNYDRSLFGKDVFLADITINPNDREEVYFSGNRSDGGIYKFLSGNLVNTFTEKNSNLELRSSPAGVISVTTIEHDENGNLWAINSGNNNFLKRFSENPNDDGNDFHIDLSSFVSASSPWFQSAEGILFDENGIIYIGSRWTGVIAYNSRTKASNNFNKRNADGDRFVDISAFTLDLSGDLWIGSPTGLRIIRNPEKILTEEVEEAEAIIIEDENGNISELFFQTTITDIEVDANNNKWVATNGGGLFFISSDGQETFNIFTTSNSPLPSNVINDIDIDPSTGSVFVATEKGLMEFKSTTSTIQAESDFSKFKIFPNPVRPEYGDVNVQIQGLTAGAVVKITDIEGNLVYEIENPVINGSGSGAVTWDTRSFSGRKVASGVYLTLITSKDGEQTKIGKLLIIR